jgi:hypothetical protein
MNVEPTPIWLFTQIFAPWSSMNFRHKVSPSPVPSTFFAAVPNRPEFLEHRLLILRDDRRCQRPEAPTDPSIGHSPELVLS